MQTKTLEVLEFDKILDMIKNYARSKLVSDMILNTRPINDKEKIQRELDQTGAMLEVIVENGNIDLFGLYDFNKIIGYVRKKGVLEPVELLKVLDLLRSSAYLKEYGENIEDSYIKDLFDRISTDDFLKNEIERSIISEDEIADNASSNLRSIRKRKTKKEEEIKNKLSFYISSSKFDDALQDKVVSIRDGRYVLPVKTNKKSIFNGIIHDRSASGNTLFIEPHTIVELNNDLSNLEIEENDEIRRILDRLSRFVEGFDVEILENQKLIARIDFLQAKAKFALANKYSKPNLTDKKKLKLKNAIHPLLKGKVVPINVEMGDGYNTLIITGPNTGGKTVSLKTVGLVNLMAQSGFFIPCDEDSLVNIFDDIFLDIGDTQSIELSLSTFSASLTNIVKITENVTDKSLVLLDELGSGTDPTEGAALAIAILNFLKNKKAMTFATTHYSELKYYALESEDVMNASVEFDIETLSPTYKLIIGTPGKSNAFEISKRLGLDSEILANAKSLLSDENKNFNTILEQLDKNKKDLEKKNKEIESYKKNIKQARNNLLDLSKKIEKQKEKIIKDAEDKANEIIEAANESSQEMLKMAKKSRNANTSNIDRSLNEIRNKYKSSRIERDEKNIGPKLSKNAPETLKVGDIVIIEGLNEKAEVIEAPDEKGNIKVQMGILKMESNIKNVTKTRSKDKIRENINKIYKTKKAMYISPTLDLRGQRYDEALRNFDKYLDDAILAGLDQAKIIHGKGTGALRKGINDYLKNNTRIDSYRPGNEKEGGFGVTVVKFK
ncbi:endonuclease MutS2 [Anaerococcus sp. AGMB00486]|uniref:Endonuclease MutS2 n=1 Tax=Anaerococcus faecalis TaxID=2742993 RepID=A0ABX2NBA2_9FIRM|nr:endonuclease MutS2 [Anaerococcus faecalis]NVF11920.1 endonuclease MutS2 [Anaerococcus faecalis]